MILNLIFSLYYDEINFLSNSELIKHSKEKLKILAKVDPDNTSTYLDL